MRRPAEARCGTQRLTGAAAIVSVVAVASSVAAGLQLVARPADGQQPSPIAVELEAALSRAAPDERVPVLIEVARLEARRPYALDRRLRAAEQASNLAGLYVGSAEELRRSVPADVAFDLQAGDVLWIGGAIAARLTAAQIRSLRGRAGVRRVYYDGLIRADLAGASRPPPLVWAPGLAAVQDPGGGLPWGLLVIGAPELWAAGATGQGSIVAIIDSGVDGEHPLLARSWRGLNASAEEAWFDPWGLTDRPVDDDPTGGIGHGTIVTTVAVGRLEPGDTLLEAGGGVTVVGNDLEVVTGVAPGAEWVAANAFERFGGATYTRRSVLLQALQWVLDPDGDPASASDVPDVVNNSWGFRPGDCDGVFDRAIDALELAGIPVVFAAGNLSAGFDTVAAPANRADLLLNAFAVGAAERSGDEVVVADNSLGGPSPCAPGAVKPEVVAPGEVPLLRGRGPTTAEVRGRTGAFTSWAAPHVSGALALLKGLNGSASANDLKDALFSTAVDLAPPGLDNRSGAGLIDLPAAAGRLGGLGGVRLRLAGWDWDAEGAALSLSLFNAGSDPFPGGAAELRRGAGGEALARATATAIAPLARGVVGFGGLPADLAATSALILHLESEGAALDFPVLLRAPPVASVQLQDGEVQFSADAHGRLGQVAGPPGFSFLGADWLTGGAFLFGMGDQVSDAAYVDVLQQPRLKSNPVGSDTDWRGRVLASGSAAAELGYDDGRALRPLGASVEQSVELVSIGDTAAFVALATSVEFDRRQDVPLMGLLLDWDFGRDSVAWDDALGASVMSAADSAGPWMALTTVPRPPTTHAAVPLGSSADGFFVAGSDNGVLTEPFTDEIKARFLRLGGRQSSTSRLSDWAQLVAGGPVATGESVVFLVAAGRSKPALRAALDSARSFAALSGLSRPAAAPSSALELLPAYPNPFDPSAGQAVNLPFLVNRGSDPVQASLEIFTISGRRVYSARHELAPALPVEPFQWSGRLEDGEAAASGVYGYVIRVGGQRKFGKFVLLK